ncbi:unnamed protein product, partial [Closterium sp. Naga37s-1]
MSNPRVSRSNASVFRGSFLQLVSRIPLALILCAAVLPRACGDAPTSCSASHSPPHSPARGSCSASTDAEGFPRYAAPVGEAPAGEAHVGGKPVGGEAGIGGAEGDSGELWGSSGGGSGRRMEEEFDWMLDDADEDADGVEGGENEEDVTIRTREGDSNEEEEQDSYPTPELLKESGFMEYLDWLREHGVEGDVAAPGSPVRLSPEGYLAGCMLLQAAAKRDRAAEGLSWAALAGVLLPPVSLARPLPLMLDDDLRMELSYKPLIDRLDQQLEQYQDEHDAWVNTTLNRSASPVPPVCTPCVFTPWVGSHSCQLDQQLEQYQDEYDAWVNTTVSQSTADNAAMSFESFLQAVAAALSVSLPLPQAPSPSAPDSSPDSRPAALVSRDSIEVFTSEDIPAHSPLVLAPTPTAPTQQTDTDVNSAALLPPSPPPLLSNDDVYLSTGTVPQDTALDRVLLFPSLAHALRSFSLAFPSTGLPAKLPEKEFQKRAAALEDRVVRAVLEVKRNVLSAAREAGGVTEGSRNSAARAGEGVAAQDGERGERGGEEHAMTGGKWYGMEQMWFWEMRRHKQLERERKKKEGEKHRMMRMKHEENGKEEKEESVAGGVDPEGLLAYPEGRIDPELLAYLTALAYLRSNGREPDPALLARISVALAWNLDGTTTCTHMPLLSLPSHPLFLPHTSSSSTTSAPSASQSGTSTANHMPPPVADLLPALRVAAGMLRRLVEKLLGGFSSSVSEDEFMLTSAAICRRYRDAGRLDEAPSGLCLPWFMGALEEVQQVLQVRANKKRVLIDTSDWLLLACDPKYDLRLDEPEPVTAAAAESKRRRDDAAAEEDEEERSDEEKLGVFLEWVRARGIPDFGKPRSTFEVHFRPEPNSSHSPSLKAHGEFAASLLQAKARSRKQLTVVAGQSKKKGQLLLSIPRSLWVSTHTMAEEAAPYANPVWTLAAGAAWLLREQARGRGSEWWPYLQILPAYVPLPFLFDAATLDELQSPSFVERIRMVREYYEQQYKLCHPPAIAFASLHQFLWALAIMNSRAFSTPAPARRTSAESHTDTTRFPQEEEREQERGRGAMLEQLLALPASERRWFVGEPMALVPIAELIDHHHPHNAQYK